MSSNRYTEILSFAIENEVNAYNLYINLSKQVSKPNVVKLFEDLAGQEQKHKKMLERILDEKKDSEFNLVDVPDLALSDKLNDPDYSDSMHFRDALVMAIKNEQQAKELYDFLAETNVDSKERNIFGFLAQQEAAHKLRLENIYKTLIGTPT